MFVLQLVFIGKISEDTWVERKMVYVAVYVDTCFEREKYKIAT